MPPVGSAEAASYFARFTGLMGKTQLVAHLTSHPQWWTLRDEQGRTPLMRALNCKGATADILSIPGAEEILHVCDSEGHNLRYHHFLQHHGDAHSEAYNRGRDLHHALDRHGVVLAAGTAKRGWMIDAACLSGRVEAPGWQALWEGDRPWHRTELFWRCTEEDGQQYLRSLIRWIGTGRRQLFDPVGISRMGRQLFNLGSFAHRTAPLANRASLTLGVQDAIGLLTSLSMNDEAGTEHVRQMYAEGRSFPLSPLGHQRLKALHHDRLVVLQHPLHFFLTLHESAQASIRLHRRVPRRIAPPASTSRCRL